MQRLDAQTQQRITVRRNEDTPASRNLCARGASAASSLCMSLLSLGLSKVTPYPGDARGILRLAPREATEPVILSAAGAKDLLFPYIGRRSGRPEGEPCVREGAMGAVLDLVRVWFEPTAVFERVREKPRFLAPFVALAIIIVLVSVVQLPYIKAALSVQFSQMPNMPPEAAQRALSFASIGIVAAPIVYALILLINALMLWVLVSVVGGEAKFATLLSVTTYASISYILLTVSASRSWPCAARNRSAGWKISSRRSAWICWSPAPRASPSPCCAASIRSPCMESF